MPSKRLVVVVPGISGNLASWQGLLTRLKAEPELSGAEWLEWDHRKRWFSLGSVEQCARELRAQLDALWLSRGPFDDVILMGHSIGGLIVRAAYLLGLGVDRETRRASAWAPAVHRVVLFAALNRGVNGLSDPNDPGPPLLRIAFWLFRMCPPLRWLTSYDAMRGSAFITNLRIQWIREITTARAPQLTVVQLLGTKDFIVTRKDSLDIEQFPAAWHADIPGAAHGDLHQLDTAEDPEGRYALIRQAVLGAVPPGTQTLPQGPGHAVFVLHGIRANNDTWARDLRAMLEQRGIPAIAPTYGFFSALKFALPATRRRYLPWFQDRYTELVAANASVQIDFIGHSNGTYLLGQSLLRIPGMRFNRVLLVGSVLPMNYPWRGRFEDKQVGELWNLRANRDVPVGFLCSLLRGLGMRDVGTGGFAGFAEDIPSTPTEAVSGAGTKRHAGKEEVFWYEGGHSAALDEENLPLLVDYVTSDSPDPRNLHDRAHGRDPRGHRLGSRLAPWVGRLAVLLVLAGLGRWILAGGFDPWRLAAVLCALVILAIALDTF